VIVTSTVAGGLWHDPATWSDGVVPTAADDAVILGEVHVDLSATGEIATCRHLTLDGAAVLRSEPNGVRTVIAHGDLHNEGAIRNGPDYASYDGATLEVEVGGDLFQGGTLAVLVTRFIGTDPQRFELGDGVSLSGAFVDVDPSSPIVAAGPISVSSASLALGGSAGRFDLGGHELTLTSGDLRVVDGALEVARITGVEGATLTADRLVADEDWIELGGDVRVAAVESIGTLTVVGSVRVLEGAALYNQSSSETTLDLAGSLVNEGIVRWGPGYAAYGPGTLTVLLDGDLTVGGPYTPTRTVFDGDVEQELATTGETTLTGLFYDSTPASALVVSSDLAIAEAEFELGSEGTGGTLDFGGFSLAHSSGTLAVPFGTVLVDSITGSTDSTAVFAVAAIAPPSGTLTLHERFPTRSLAIDGDLVVAAGAVLHNALDVEARVTVSGVVTIDGVSGTGQGYASYDDGRLYLNDVEQFEWRE